MTPTNLPAVELRHRIRWVLGLFIVALVVSGITAFPLQRELDMLVALRGAEASGNPGLLSGLDAWLLTVRNGLRSMYTQYPWIAYGTDWLAFAHIIIAIFFIGPLRDPVRNVWVIQAGVIACGLVVPLALIAGPIRQIPFGWQLIDCSFGVLGVFPLWYCLRLVRHLENTPGLPKPPPGAD